MSKYLVTYTQHHEYSVEAENEEEAEKLAFIDFRIDMRSSIANLHYDEVTIEEQEEDETD